jgi:hypothetical protein
MKETIFQQNVGHGQLPEKPKLVVYEKELENELFWDFRNPVN